MRRAEAVEMDEQGIAVAAPLKAIAIVRREREVLVVGLIESRTEAVEEGGPERKKSGKCRYGRCKCSGTILLRRPLV